MTDSSEYQGLMYASAGIGAISSIVGAFTQSSAYKAQGDIEASIARTNSNIAKLQSKEAIEQGEIEASREDIKTNQIVGSVRATQGASGIDVASGSSALVRNSITSVGDQDELTIRNNAQRRAFGYQAQALQETGRGEFAQLTAKAQSTQSLINGGLQAIQVPLGIYANSLRWQRFEGGGGDRLPFDQV